MSFNFKGEIPTGVNIKSNAIRAVILRKLISNKTF